MSWDTNFSFLGCPPLLLSFSPVDTSPLSPLHLCTWMWHHKEGCGTLGPSFLSSCQGARWCIRKCVFKGYLFMESVLASGKWEKGWVRQTVISFSFSSATLRQSLFLTHLGIGWVSFLRDVLDFLAGEMRSENLQGNTLPHRASCFPFPHFPLSFIMRALGLPFHVSCKHLKSAPASAF